MTTALIGAPTRRARRDGDRRLVPALLEWAATTGGSVHLVGPHGIGKTSHVKAWAAANGLRVVEKSLAVVTSRDFCVPVPVVDAATGHRNLRILVLDELRQRSPDDRYVLLLDEFSRADGDTRTTAMELLQEHTVAGEALPGLAAVVALDNPPDGAYRGVGQLDLAQADRVAAASITAADLPWVEHLEATHGRDLTELHRVWSSWPEQVRRALPPRLIEHAIQLADADLPISWVVPVLADGRQTVPIRDDEPEHDLHEWILQLADLLDSPADLGCSVDPLPATTRAVSEAIARGWKLRIVGAPGIGKTSHVRAAVEAAGLEVEYLSLAQTSAADLVVPIPVDGRLEHLLAERLVDPDRRYVLVLDEFSRARQEVAAAAMELVQERSIAGRPLPGCVAVIALDNPAQVAGIPMQTGRLDPAQASRFTATLELEADHLPWRDVLTDRWGHAAGPVLAWRAEDLDDAGRVLVSPRCTDRLISLVAAGLDPELGLPVVGGERVPVPIALLRRRLEGAADSVSLTAIAEDLDAWSQRLADDDLEAQITVTTTLQRTEAGALEEHHEAVVQLVDRLSPAQRMTLARCGGERGRRFVAVLRDLGGAR